MERDIHIAENDRLKAENEVLRTQLLAALEQLREHDKKLTVTEQQAEAYREKVAYLTFKLAELERMIFGVKSERFEPSGGPGQLPLFEESSAGEGDKEAAASEEREPSRDIPYPRRRKRKPKRQVLPAHLPREIFFIEPDEDVSGLKKIGDEVTETLDWRPSRLVVIRRVRPKYVDPTQEDRGVLIGDLPPRPIDKGVAEPGLISHVIAEKYVYHVPYYRQIERYKREGVYFASSTFGDWTSSAANIIVPLYDVLGKDVLESGYIQADETPIQVQDLRRTDNRPKKKKTHRGYFWVYHGPDHGLAYFDYQPGRNGEGPREFLVSYEGALQTDGYKVYDDYDTRPGITTYGCWAHDRRYFHKALESEPEMAERALTEIARLYDIERYLRENNASAEERYQMRQEKAVPILKDFKKWLEANVGLPKSPWGKAVAYSLRHWKKLLRYTENGRIEIDNNLVENKIRPVAIGRKNYLFAGSHDAAQRSAIIYSLFATCICHDVNPQQWLADVLARIPTHPQKRIHELLPYHWKKSKR